MNILLPRTWGRHCKPLATEAPSRNSASRTGTRRTLAASFLDRIRTCLKPSQSSRITDPLHSSVPALRDAEMAAIYYGRRMAGDFYEFLRVGPSRVLFGLFDVAGRREDTRQVLIAAQATFRRDAPALFAHDCNEAVAMIELSQRINRTILQFEGRVRSCPAFLGCYNEALGTVCYSNAGHTPGLIRDATGITRLEATGLPLGLFSHTTRSVGTCALLPGAVLLVVSRGVVETECDNEEFGLENVTVALCEAAALTASAVCVTILEAIQQFVHAAPTHNDVTTLALLRRQSRSPALRLSQKQGMESPVTP